MHYFAFVAVLLGFVGCGGGMNAVSTNSRFSPKAVDELIDEVPMPDDIAIQLSAKLSADARIQSLCGQARPSADTCKFSDQKASPWCAGFSNLRILEENQRSRIPNQSQLSIMHFASMGTPHKGVPLFSAVNYKLALEQVQRRGQLMPESDFPFDGELFADKVKAQIDAAFAGPLHLGTIDTPLFAMKISDAVLTTAQIGAKSLRDFENNLEVPLNQFVVKNYTGSFHTTPIAAFDWQEEFYDSDAFTDGVAALLGELRSHSVNTNICAAQADRENPGAANAPSRFNGYCGAHAVDIVTARIFNGRCQVLVTNSWGEGWANHGSIWLDLDKYVRWVPFSPTAKSADLRWLDLHSATETAAVQNRILKRASRYEYVGVTQNGIPVGRGDLVDGDTHSIGVFVDGNLEHGQIRTTFAGSTKPQSEFDGNIKNRRYTDGHLKEYGADGKVIYEFQGSWAADGSWWNGHLTKFDKDKNRWFRGEFHDGVWKND